jgi:HSP20 family molecular chaperone IbpA
LFRLQKTIYKQGCGPFFQNRKTTGGIMATDTGAAKAKDTLKDREDSSAQREVRDFSTYPAARGASANSNSNPISVPINLEDHRLQSKLNNKLSNRAYELFEQSGANHGDDLFHWLQAESEILTRIPAIRQTDSSFSVVAPLDGFNPEEISITVEPNRALILADKQTSSYGNGSDVSRSSRESVFFTTNWPDQVEPSTATAQFKEGNLVLTMKRANATSQRLQSRQ